MSAYSASVALPTLGSAEDKVDELQIVQEEYKHDLAIYSISRRSRYHVYRTGLPISVAWSTGRERAAFYGYVHHTEPSPDPSRMQVWCKGMSQTLDNGAQYSFRNRTVPSVVAELAALMGFDVSAEHHGQVFDSIVLNETVWPTLVRYAKEIGYSFYAKNSRLELHRRTALVEKHANVAPVFGGSLLRDFSPISGAAPPGQSRAHRVISGTDRRTGGRFRVIGGVAPSKLGKVTYMPAGTRYLDENAGTPEEARWRLAALAENDRYSITATAVTDGAPQLHQTWPVLLNTTDADYRGLWFVRKVVHQMSGGDYSMELDLGKDALESNTEIPDQRAKRVLVTRNTPQGRPKVVYPPTILRDGQWQSQWSAASRTFRGA